MGNNKKELNDGKIRVEYFLKEIKRQCEYVFISIDILNNSLENHVVRNTFYAIQNLFTSLGNISKILYPTAKYRHRGKLLREKLGINDNSQFFYDHKSEVARKYRNILEHYDEYFEDWYNEGDNRIIIENNIGPKNMILMGGLSPKVLRHYDAQNYKFIFLDDEYDIIPVINETSEIYNKIIAIEGEKFDFTRK